VRFTVRGGLNVSDAPSWRVSLLPSFSTDAFAADPTTAYATLSAALAAAVPCVGPAAGGGGDTTDYVECSVGSKFGQGSYLLALQVPGGTMYVLPSPAIKVLFAVTGVTPNTGSIGGGTMLNITGERGQLRGPEACMRPLSGTRGAGGHSVPISIHLEPAAPALPMVRA
jgi:hypothetical protein